MASLGFLRVLAMSASVLPAFWIGMAQAQTAPAVSEIPSADSPAENTVDIVVTARRREESLQAVPVSVTVATPTILREQRIVTSQDLQNLAPSLTVTSRTGQQQSGAFNIRGQGQTFGGALPSVITYFAEVPLESQGGAAFALYDIDSIQVLRGPQGTLFGRNTNGGAVLLTPTAPKSDLGGYIDASYGNLDYVDLKGALNFPITATLGLRIAGNLTRRDGYVRNLAGRDFNDIHQDSWRIYLRFQPSDSFTNDLVYNGLDADEGGSAYILSAIRPGKLAATFGGGALVSALAQQKAWGPRTVSNTQDGLGAKRNVQLVANTTTMNFGDITLKNIASYERVKVCYGTDLDGVEVRNSYTTCFENDYSRAAGIKLHPDTNLKQFTEELQLSGTAFDQRVDFLLGAFYLRAESPGGLNTFRAARNAYNGSSAATVAPNFSTAQFRDESKALFAQGTVHLGAYRQISLTAGMRYTWDTRRASFGRITANGPIDTPPPLSSYGCTLPGIGASPTTPVLQCFRKLSGKYDDIGYNLSADWKPVDDLLLYATTRRGFKDGGFNTLVASANNPEYRPEVVTDYEAGAKWSFNMAGGVRGRLNVDAFTSKYDGIQRQVTGGIPVTAVIVNAGTGRIKGIEAEGLIQLDEFSISGFFAYLNASYNGFIDSGIDVSASKFIGVPATSGGATARWEHEMGSTGTIIASATLYSTSRFAIESNNVLNFEGIAPSYTTLAARLEWRNVGAANFDLAFWGKNITNKLYVQGGVPQGNSSGITSYLFGEPATYGVQAAFRF